FHRSLLQVRERAVVLDHEGGALALLRCRHLRGDHALCLVLLQIPDLHQPPQPLLLRRIDQDDDVECVFHADLEEQRDRVHDDADALLAQRVLARPAELLDLGGYDRLEGYAGGFVAEDDVAHGGTVQRAVGLEDLRAEVRHHALKALTSGLDRLAREHVRVDDVRAERRPDRFHGAFAARDVAGQSHAKQAVLLLRRRVSPAPAPQVYDERDDRNGRENRERRRSEQRRQRTPAAPRNIPERHVADAPDEHARDIIEYEAAVRHAAHAGEPGHDRAHERDAAREGDGHDGVAAEERYGAVLVAVPQPADAAAVHDAAHAVRTAEPVSQLITAEPAEQRRQEDMLELEEAGRREKRREQDGRAGRHEQADERGSLEHRDQVDDPWSELDDPLLDQLEERAVHSASEVAGDPYVVGRAAHAVGAGGYDRYGLPRDFQCVWLPPRVESVMHGVDAGGDPFGEGGRVRE